ncbi:MAG: N-acetylmuramoyl-L-alanine amidase [Gammaproteobacteria bacterium]|nr:N-acetylmuramoyl-L-alanine amidase [Gammaproteobacteria bacterium]
MRLLVFCFFAVLLSGVVPVASAADITGLRVWHAPDQTRFVFDLTGPTRFDVFPITGPHRVVIDLHGATTRAALALPATVTERVQDLRHGRTGQGVRVVLDLAHAVEVRQILLPPRAPYGHRLVVDVLDPPGYVHKRPTEAPVAPARAVPPPSPGSPFVASAPEVAGRAPIVTPSATVPPPASTPPAAPEPVVAATLPTWRRDGVVVAIDAGHGGDDVGAIGPRGTYEKDVVLAIARELRDLINREPGMRAVMIRDGDYYVGLRQRIEKARGHRADMFVSIHADAFRDRRVRGSSVFVISRSGATSEAARWLAERENSADLVGGVTLEDKDPQLRSVLLDLSQTASLKTSLEVASSVLGKLRALGPTHGNRVQQAGFVVLKSPDIPSLLVETAFISNPVEEQRLRNHRFRTRLAAAIRDGITGYFDRAAPRDERMASSDLATTTPPRRHHVSRGETLSGIAMHYSVSQQEIRLANSMDDDIVRSGQTLRIP